MSPPPAPAAVFGSISGIAPRARIAAYKVCWQTPTGGSCFTSDSVAAIDQAVADGVDVINFSISGSTTNFRDPVEIAFLFAADAGVFVAASAGNSGPTTSTVAHPGPWLTTVAAGTHNRNGARLRDIGQRRNLFRRVRGDCGRPRTPDRLQLPRACLAPIRLQSACAMRRQTTVAHAGAGSRQGGRQDRYLRSRRNVPV